MLEDFDRDDFWDDSVTPELLCSMEKEPGFRLPASLVRAGLDQRWHRRR